MKSSNFGLFIAIIVGVALGTLAASLTGCSNIPEPRQASDAVKCWTFNTPVFVGKDKNVYYDVDVTRCHDPVLNLYWDKAAR